MFGSPHSRSQVFRCDYQRPSFWIYKTVVIRSVDSRYEPGRPSFLDFNRGAPLVAGHYFIRSSSELAHFRAKHISLGSIKQRICYTFSRRFSNYLFIRAPRTALQSRQGESSFFTFESGAGQKAPQKKARHVRGPITRQPGAGWGCRDGRRLRPTKPSVHAPP